MGRNVVINLAPASTGAAIAITKGLPECDGRFNGVAIRTPVAIGSISDITFITSRATTPEEVNQILKEEAASEPYKSVVTVSNHPLVFTDIIKSPLQLL